MFKIQHIGIPTKNLQETLSWYETMQCQPVYRTVLPDGVHVAFINVFGVLLEFYEDEVQVAVNPTIHKIIMNTPDKSGEFIGPSGEVLVLQTNTVTGLDHIELNTTSIEATGNHLLLHGFNKQDKHYVQGSVKFELNQIEDMSVVTGAVNHIAFDEKHVNKKLQVMGLLSLPIVEGVNFLPFFDNGVIYFVTENHDGLRLEYNQIL